MTTLKVYHLPSAAYDTTEGIPVAQCCRFIRICPTRMCVIDEEKDESADESLHHVRHVDQVHHA